MIKRLAIAYLENLRITYGAVKKKQKECGDLKLSLLYHVRIPKVLKCVSVILFMLPNQKYLTSISISTYVNIISTGCIENNIEYIPKDDITGQGSTQESNVETCQMRCENTVGCAYFSFLNNGDCHLSSNAAIKVKQSGVIGGLKKCPDIEAGE